MRKSPRPTKENIYNLNDKSHRGLFFSIIYGGTIPPELPRYLLKILQGIRDVFVTKFQMHRHELAGYALEDLAYLCTSGDVLSVQIKGPREFITSWGKTDTLVFLRGAAEYHGDATQRQYYLERIFDTQPRAIHKVFRRMNFEFSEDEWEEIKAFGLSLDIPFNIPNKSGKRRNLEREKAEFVLAVMRAAANLSPSPYAVHA